MSFNLEIEMKRKKDHMQKLYFNLLISKFELLLIVAIDDKEKIANDSQ